MRAITDWLPDLLQTSDLNSELYQGLIFGLWNRVVGEELARRSWPLRCLNGILTIRVQTHGWQNEFHKMEAKIRTRINRILRKDVLRSIEFIIDEAFAGTADDSPSHNRIQQTQPLDSIIVRAGNEIEDSELRRLFSEVVRKNLGLQSSGDPSSASHQ